MSTSPEFRAALLLRYEAARRAAELEWVEYRQRREERGLRRYTRRLRQCRRIQDLITKYLP
jgi:hypothetical protein